MTTTIEVGKISEAENNPNVMEPERFNLLVKAIKKIGFVQPILVRKVIGGGYEVVDGHHRLKAAKEIGLAEVPCVVADIGHEQAKAVQVGMNRLRGELDLTKVGAGMSELLDAGWSIDDLTLTGFTLEEIGSLVESIRSTTEDVLRGADASVPENDDKPIKPFLIELTFSRREDMMLAKKKLKHAAGKGGDLADGLLNLIGEK